MGDMDDRDTRANAIIEVLGLEPHPERGCYRQTYRAALDVPTSNCGLPLPGILSFAIEVAA